MNSLFVAWLVLFSVPFFVCAEHPPDYDYQGFSRGSEYHEKDQAGEMDDTNQNYAGTNDVDGHKNDDPGHWEIECEGNSTYKNMTLHHYGFGYHMYGVEDSTCKASGGDGHHHFVLIDVVQHDICAPIVHKLYNMDVYTIDLVIQQHPHIRTQEDPVYSITCNYENTGRTRSTQQTSLVLYENPHSQMGRRMHSVDGPVSASNATLSVHDQEGYAIEETVIGEWVQLQAWLYNLTAEVTSFRVFHCLVQSAETPENGFDILVKGCGDGKVIAEDQGFYTPDITEAGATYQRKSVSIFFKAFTVPDGNQVIYTCDYVECKDASNCDGASCTHSQHSNSNVEGASTVSEAGRRRRRRSVPEEDNATNGRKMLSVTSPPLKIISPNKDPEAWRQYKRNQKEKVVKKPVPNEKKKPDVFRNRLEGSRGMTGSQLGLIIGLSVLLLGLVLVVFFVFFLVHRSSKRRLRRNADSYYSGIVNASSKPLQKDSEYVGVSTVGSPGPELFWNKAYSMQDKY